MAYLLQPDLERLKNPAIPPVCATETVIALPQPSSLNYCCRPNTALYGTAPYMAGKGAPGHLVDVADELRPQSTTQFGKVYVNNSGRDYFPIQNVDCMLPQRTLRFNPANTRAQVQNGLFAKRYCKN